MILSLKYRDLSKTVSNTNELAEEIGEYCDQLSRKVQTGIYSVEGGMSSALNSADYYVKAKINQLRIKESNAQSLSLKTQMLLDTANRVDIDVKNMISSNQKNFFKRNPDMKAPSTLQRAWISFICDEKVSVLSEIMKSLPNLGGLINASEFILNASEQWEKDLRYWWKCKAGQEIISAVGQTLLATVLLAGAIASVVAICAGIVIGALAGVTLVTGGAIILAGLTCVVALIATVNAITNVNTTYNAIKANKNGDPAMAKIYGERSTLPKVLRENNFHNKFENNFSNLLAFSIETTEAVAGLSIGVLGVSSFLTGNRVGFAFKELYRSSNGTLKTKVTRNSILRGAQAMISDKNLTKSTSLGLRTTLITNISQGLAYDVKLVSLGVRDIGRFLEVNKQGNVTTTTEELAKLLINIKKIYKNGNTLVRNIAGSEN